MKPVLLKFSGINSFSDDTKIDFGPLTKSGLFGIFGDTGSGKSSILDAINFALFGDVNRVGGKGVDYINTKCEECYADFTFDVNSGGTYTEYEVVRRKKRDKTERNKQGDHKVALFQKGEDGKFFAIASSPNTVDKMIPQILGVGEDDFRMCIALPQGEFAQFLNAGPIERSRLMQRLFDLSRYGDPLSRKISSRAAEANASCTLLQKQMEDYKDVTKDALTEADDRMRAAMAERDKIREQQGTNTRKITAYTILDNQHKDLIKAQKRLDRLNEDKDEMESLKRDLSALPACRETASLRRKADSYKRDIADLKDTKANLADKIDKNCEDLRKCQQQLKEGDFDHNIATYTALLASYATCAGVPESLKTHQKKLAGLKGKRKDAEDRAGKLAGKLADARTKAGEDRAAFEAYKEDDISALIPEDFKDAILKAGYEDFSAFLASLSSRILPYEATESELYAIVRGEISAEAAFIADKLSSVPEGTTDLSVFVKNIQRVMKEKSALQARAAESASTVEKLDSDLRMANSDAEHFSSDIDSENVQIEELQKRLEAVYGKRTDYNACRREAEAGKSAAESEKMRLNTAVQNYTDLQNTLSAQKQAAETSLREKSSYLDAVENDILDAVSRAGKDSEQECLQIVEKYKGIPHAEDTMKAYEDEVIGLNAQIAKLIAEPGVKDYDKSLLENANAEKARLDAAYEQYTEDITRLDGRTKDLREGLIKKGELERDYKKAAHKKELIDELSKLIGKGEFLNFVAEEYLADISDDASEMLSRLSKGQFCLKYEGKKFIILDNFDEGKPRQVNTLSGGETFLVSLSLALSLSKITSGRSEKMIEFFFLDEGFGSLDTRLCDEVVDALETVRIKYPEFTIGVISHVEELMQRIENKILVDKATDTRGSTVRVSY
ncbi:MAG: SMC family ATPase [Clostridia bacterium]|nr:SMC family ATPase [Clostridia bacterium]